MRRPRRLDEPADPSRRAEEEEGPRRIGGNSPKRLIIAYDQRVLGNRAFGRRFATQAILALRTKLQQLLRPFCAIFRLCTEILHIS